MNGWAPNYLYGPHQVAGYPFGVRYVGQTPDVLQKTGENPHALLIQVGQLRAKVDELVNLMGSGEGTDPAIFQEVSKLQVDVTSLETDAAKLDQGQVSAFEMFTINYPFLLNRYNTLAAQYETFGVGQAPPPPQPAPPVYQPPVGQPPVYVPPTQQPPVGSPQKDATMIWVVGGVAIVLVGLAALVLVKT